MLAHLKLAHLNLKVESIDYHAISASHRGHVQVKKSREGTPDTSIAEKSISKVNKSPSLHLRMLFRTAQGLTKRGRLFSDFG